MLKMHTEQLSFTEFGSAMISHYLKRDVEFMCFSDFSTNAPITVAEIEQLITDSNGGMVLQCPEDPFCGVVDDDDQLVYLAMNVWSTDLNILVERDAIAISLSTGIVTIS